MSAIAVGTSSLRTSLARYGRSWGFWLLLLVAPVGARFMISGDDGKGLVIAVGGHLPVLTGPVLGVWLGIVVSTLLLPVGFIYLRSNANRRQPWQVEEVTAGSRVAIMLGRFAADVAVLFGMLAALTLAGWFLAWLLVSGPLELVTLTIALWIIAGPALMGIAALRILFDAVPWLRSGLGDTAFLILWMASIVVPAAAQGQVSSLSANMYDFPGFIRPLVGETPAKEQDIIIGGGELEPGRVALDVERGLQADGYVESRGVWAIIAILIAAMSGLVYGPHAPPKRPKTDGVLSRLLAYGPPPAARADAPAAKAAAVPVLGLILAEFRLIGSGRVFKILAVVAAVVGCFGDYRHIGSPVASLLLVFALSAHAGRSEARKLVDLSAQALLSPMVRRFAFVLAGVGWSVLLALPAIAVRMTAEPVILAVATGLAASAIAIVGAMVTRSGFAPRIALLILWYGYMST